MSERKKIAIVGAGPMAIFLVKHLITAPQPLRIILFERHGVAGPGMPYRQDMSPDYMLSNIFSREIPRIHDTLAGWLRNQPADRLARWNLSPDDISARAFYPRTLLGAYLAAQLKALVAKGVAAGHEVEVRTHQDVVDVRPEKTVITVAATTPDGTSEETFDQVVLATGHTWDADPTEGDAALVSPWPASNITALPAGAIGVLGSSLSAVDVAVALAHEHGQFADTPDGLTWAPHPRHEALRITMVSKTGILPEADFYYAYPYEPLTHLTERAVDRIVADGDGQILQRTFDLMMQEIRDCDPAYLDDLRMDAPAIEAFGSAYFARRQRMGAFRALRTNLAESRATILRQETIPWRYALLRGHEVFEAALPHLSADEWETFRTHLLPVFADCYAAVPHLSLDRLAALRAADAVDIVHSGEDAQFLARPDGGVVVRIGDDDLSFDAMVDARGQTQALPADLPFPSLVARLIDPSRPVEDPFRLALLPVLHDGVFCLSMPQVLVRYPFSQGLPNCDTLTRSAADAIINAVRPDSRMGKRTVAV